MELVEIRDLDGPNLFLPQPTIKVEVLLSDADAERGPVGQPSAVEHLVAAIRETHQRCGFPAPTVVTRPMETPGHWVVAFSWEQRRAARGLAEAVVEATSAGVGVADDRIAQIAALASEGGPSDIPLWIRDVDRRVLAVGITGTNGKTTTTRLLAHLMREQGRRVGWCSTSGVYINGNEVEHGDYSGPAGARRVLGDSGIDVAILEIARGGILLRGLATESLDIAVYLNVSGDHLGLQGVHTVEELARVKQVVVDAVHDEGVAVLNADDPLVLAGMARVRGRVMLTSQLPGSPAIEAHLAGGGEAVVVRDGQIVRLDAGEVEVIAPLDEVPLAFGGRARHMVENVLASTGATLAAGLSADQVRRGLATFGSEHRHNPGRLNVIERDGVTWVIDYAHNEAGLQHLLEFGQGLRQSPGRLFSIIGIAGDRQDEVMVAVGRMAGEGSDVVVAKASPRYLRDRAVEELLALQLQGVREAGHGRGIAASGELDAVQQVLAMVAPGDVVVVMSHDQTAEVLGLLTGRDSGLD